MNDILPIVYIWWGVAPEPCFRRVNFPITKPLIALKNKNKIY